MRILRLVCRKTDLERAGRNIELAECCPCINHRCDATFHVRRAKSVEMSVTEHRVIRVGFPFGSITGGLRIKVAIQHQDTPWRASNNFAYEVWTGGFNRDAFQVLVSQSCQALA